MAWIDEIENVLRQIKKATYIGIHAGNYGLRHYLSHEQKLIVEAALAALSRPALAPAEQEQRVEKDEAYRQRNHLVAAIARLFPSGIRATNIPGWDADWHGCVYIDLPSGQISYHYHDSQAGLFRDLPPYTKEWDGHDKDTVHQRLSALTRFDRPAPIPATVRNRTSLIRAMCHAAAVCKCADRGGIVDDYDACRIVSRHANAIIDSIPSPDAGRVPEGFQLVPKTLPAEMLAAFDRYNDSHVSGAWTFQECWDEVLAASPAYDEVKS